MAVVRILGVDLFDFQSNRFKSTAFEPDRRNGNTISVVDEPCGIRETGTICDHLRVWYPTNTQGLHVLWKFELGDMGDGCDLLAVPSESGDECHRDLAGLTKARARSILRQAHQGSCGTF